MKNFKKQFGIFFLLLALLASSQSAFSFTETSVAKIPVKENTLKKLSNHTLIYVEEVSILNGYQPFADAETNFLIEAFPSFYFLKISEKVRFSESYFQFLQHKNKLLDQQIFPFHFFW